MVFNKHLKYGKIIESIILFFHLQDAQTDKTPIECSRERRDCVLLGRRHFSRHYERINCATKQL